MGLSGKVENELLEHLYGEMVTLRKSYLRLCRFLGELDATEDEEILKGLFIVQEHLEEIISAYGPMADMGWILVEDSRKRVS